MKTVKVGKHELSLPEHMTSLSQDIIEDVVNNGFGIISCGVDPNDRGLYMVTSQIEVKRILPNGSLRPIQAFPLHNGELLGVLFENDEQVVHHIESELALLAAENCMNISSLYVNDTYMCDIEAEPHVILRDEDENRINLTEETDR